MTARLCVIAALSALPCALPIHAQTLTAIPAPNGGTMLVSSPARDTTPEPTGTGRIRGRVVDGETGGALRDTMLQLSGGGLRQPRILGTDDEGRYEFENLPAGRFNITASKPGYMLFAYGQRRPFESGKPIDLADTQTLANIDFAVPRGGIIVARVTDLNGEPIADVRVVAQRYRFSNGQRVLTQVAPVYQVTDDRGELRVFGLPPGEYYVSSGSSDPSSLAAGKGTAYVPTFFPGTASVDNAERVTVQVGKEVNVSFQLLAARRGRVSGIVRRSDGSPAARASVLLLPRTGGFVTQAVTQPDGAFSFADVTPGEYTLQSQFSSGAAATDREQGRAPINATGADINGLVLGLTKAGRIRGHVSFDTPVPSSVALTALRPTLTVSGAVPGLAPTGIAPITQADGTFVIDGIVDPGFIRVGALPLGWFLKSVSLAGKDVTDTPVGVEGGGELTGVEIVLTQAHAELSGGAVDAKGAAATDYTVIVFADDRAQWTQMASRFFATARPDQQGRFKVATLPPGKYLAAAVDYVEAGAERDPELLGRLRERATPVTIGDGESKTVTLPIQ